MRLRSTNPWRVALLAASSAALISLALVLWVRTGPARHKTVLLRGTIVVPDGVIDDGWILIEQGRIRRVSTRKPDVANAVEMDTGGIIFPGLIDLHNHISYDVLPPWRPAHLYADRYEWRTDPDYVRRIDAPYKRLIAGHHFCDMNAWGEVRALAGGTTSMLATAPASCIRGLVRNLDHDSGFYGFFERDREHIRSEIEMRSTTAASIVGAARTFVEAPRAEALLIHVAEGIDESSRNEFELLRANRLLGAKTAIVHGIPLLPSEFEAMRQAGTSLVWSPRSNIALYGRTADVGAALDAGVRVALAPDWAVTGSSNLLEELHFAAQWNVEHLSSGLSDQQLVAMVTSIPAQIAGVDDEVGAIRPGLYADLLVISGNRSVPARALLEARAKDVQLVLVGGQPLYGAPKLMERYWERSELDAVKAGGAGKVVKLPARVGRMRELEARLQKALGAEGTQLTPSP